MVALTVVTEWMNYIGRFHPLIVHLPIGILFLVFLLELLAWKTGKHFREAVSITLLAGAASAVFSCLLGWMLARDGGYPEPTVSLHFWFGWSLAVFTATAWFVQKKQPSLLYRIHLWVLLILLMITGHYGGNMTHGADYLTAGLPTPLNTWAGEQAGDDSLPPPQPVTNVLQARVYYDLVAPVFQQKCYSCHSAVKMKGGLRMDTKSLLFKGGKHGPVIEPGNTTSSDLLQRILLPLEDDKHMAPKEEPQLNKEEVALLNWWIATGANTEQTVHELAPDSATLKQLTYFEAAAASADSITPLSKIYDETVPPANQQVLDALRAKGILINPIAQSTELLELSCVNFADFDGATAASLLELKEQLVSLKLDHTKITDADMKIIAQLSKLVRLSMIGTSITGAGLGSITDLSNLEYINITDTRVDDGGLQQLASMPSLKTVFCWNILISDNGIKELQKTLPSAKITGRVF